jgi:hypothetical protein
MNELQRIGRILGVKADVDDKTMCLLIQDKIKKKDSEVKKKNFSNNVLMEKVKSYESEIHNLKNEYAESVGLQEYMMLKKSYNTLKKDYNKVLEDRHNLRKSIELYRANYLQDKIKAIEGVR